MTEMFSLTVLGPEVETKVLARLVLARLAVGYSVHVSLPASGVIGSLWISLTYRPISPIFASIITWCSLCVCVQISHFYKDTVILGQVYPADLIFT